MSRKSRLFGGTKFRSNVFGTLPSARLLSSLVLLALAASPSRAAPRLSEEARSVQVDEPFDVTLTQPSGTGTSWIAHDLAGVTVTGQDVVSRATMPGGSRQVIFHLVARATGERILEWNLIGASPSTVLEIHRLSLHVEKRSQ